MLCGTPVIASDLPGVRQPVLESGMGKLVPPGDPPALARAVLDVLSRKQRSYRRACSWCRTLAPEAVAGSYETLFTRLVVRG
jgi:glycosyltransferase involved in cell wall biosynthesis